MNIALTNYTGIVLDETFFTHEIPRELHQQFHSARVLFPRTLHECLEQNSVFLDAARKNMLRQNGGLLPAKENISYMAHYPDLDRSLCHLSEESRTTGERFLYITGNQLSIQKVVLQELNLDLLDLKNQVMIPADRFQTLKHACGFEFQDEGKEMLPDVPATATAGGDYERAIPKILYNEFGSEIRIKKNEKEVISGCYEEGGEAKLFFVEGRPDYLAKVFFPANRYLGKVSNIEQLQKLPESDMNWAMLPRERLFWDREQRHFAGYLQHFARDTLKIRTQIPSIEDFDSYCDRSCVTALDTALKLTRQCLNLNTYGFYLCDFNPKNFALDPNDDRYVLMWDTDSFCGGNYFSGNFTPEISHRLRDFPQRPGNKKDVIDMCTEQLYATVYWIVTLRSVPWELNLETNIWNYTDPVHDPDLEIIVPKRLQVLFRQVFQEGELPSADLLLYELSQARKMLDPKMTYEELLENQAGPEPEPPETPTVNVQPRNGQSPQEGEVTVISPDVWPPLLEPVVMSMSQEDHFSMPLMTQMKTPPPVLSDMWNKRRRMDLKMRAVMMHPYKKPASRRFNQFRRLTGRTPKQAFVGPYLPLWQAALLMGMVVLVMACLGVQLVLSGLFSPEIFSGELFQAVKGYLTDLYADLKEFVLWLWSWAKDSLQNFET